MIYTSSLWVNIIVLFLVMGKQTELDSQIKSENYFYFNQPHLYT